MPQVSKLLSLILFLAVYICAASAAQIKATVHTDRASFIAASQNLRTYNFDDQPITERSPTLNIDGLVFQSLGGIAISGSAANKILYGATVGESTFVRLYLPPGTTAVAFEQSTAPMRVRTSGGEEFVFTNNGTMTFVGFTSATEIQSLTVSTDPSPNIAGSMFLDNLLVGLQNTGNAPPTPMLLTEEQAGRAVALDSVTLARDPFTVSSQLNFSIDRLTRVSLFAVNIVLAPGEGTTAVLVQAEDGQGRRFNLPVEFVGTPRFSWLTQIVVKLPNELRSLDGPVNITITVHGAVSNAASVRIRPS